CTEEWERWKTGGTQSPPASRPFQGQSGRRKQAASRGACGSGRRILRPQTGRGQPAGLPAEQDALRTRDHDGRSEGIARARKVAADRRFRFETRQQVCRLPRSLIEKGQGGIRISASLGERLRTRVVRQTPQQRRLFAATRRIVAK